MGGKLVGAEADKEFAIDSTLDTPNNILYRLRYPVIGEKYAC